MTKQWLKFIKRRSAKEQARILEVAEKITLNQLKGLDIETIKGVKNKFRCRVGDLRIVFTKLPNGDFFIEGIGNRGDIY